MVIRERLRDLQIAHPIVLGLLLLGYVVLFFACVSVRIQSFYPSDGTLWSDLSPKGVFVSLVLIPSATPLQVGDQILAVDGTSVWDWADNALRRGPVPDWQVGDTLIYRLVRRGEVLNVPVTLRIFPWRRLLLLRFGVYLLAVVSMVVGTTLLLTRPGEWSVRLLYLATWALSLVLLLHLQLVVLVIPQFFLTVEWLKLVARIVLFGAALDIFLTLPVTNQHSNFFRTWLWGGYALALLVVTLLVLFLSPTALLRLIRLNWAVGFLGVWMLTGGAVSVILKYLATRNPVLRSQLRWLAWGTGVGLGPYLLLSAIPEIVIGRAILSVSLTSFFLVILPVAIAIAVARYRLFEADIFIHRGLVYVLLLALAVGTYLFLEEGGRLLRRSLAWPLSDIEIVGVAVALGVSLFWILRPFSLQFADRFLYRNMTRSQHFLKQMTERLTGSIRLDELAGLLTQEVPAILRSSRGGLLVLSEDGTCLEMVGSASFCIPLNEMFDEWLEHNAEPVFRSMPQPWVKPEALALMEQRDVELVVPLRVGEQVVGLLSFGPRVDGMAYTTGEVQIITSLAHQAALAVQNARLVRRLEAHRQELEEEVQRRTEVMARDRDRLNAILQNMADALLVTDAQGRILMMNPAFEDMMRRSSRSLLGHPLSQVLDLPELTAATHEVLEHPGTMSHVANITLSEPVLRTASEDIFFTERVLKASVTSLQDKSAVIMILRDVTREVEVDRMKSEFISAVSHELRTPLTSILGFAKLTRRTFERAVTPVLPGGNSKVQRAAQRIERNLDIMVTEGDRLTDLINDVLDIAALDAGTVQWSDQLYELQALIYRVSKRVSEDAERKGLQFTVEVEPSIPLMKADPDRIEQVLVNLISNAVKFTEEGGVHVSARTLPAGETVHGWEVPPAGGVIVSIVDTGVGIAPRDLWSIFDRFRQGGDVTQGKPQGTGLGLAISREIIFHYGGEIWVESELGKGASFYFMLPLSQPSASSEVETASPESKTALEPTLSIKVNDEDLPLVFLVDESEDLQAFFESGGGADGGCRVSVFNGDQDLLDQIRRHQPSLVVLELSKQSDAKIGVLRQFKDDPVTRLIPVVVTSSKDRRDECMALGVAAYFAKPIDLNLFEDTVSLLLKKAS